MNGIGDSYLEDTTQAGSTIYGINNCVVDIPWPIDLNTLSACVGILNYYPVLAWHCMKDTFGIDITTDWFGRNVPSTMEDVAAESDDEFAIFDDVDLTGNPWAQAG